MKNLIKCEYCGTTYDPSEGPCPICRTDVAEGGSYLGDHFDFDERPAKIEVEEPAPRGGKIFALIGLLVLFCGLSFYILYAFELLPFLKPTQATVAVSTDVHCTQLAVSVSEITLDEPEQSTRIQTVVQPANTTDPVNYSVDHPEIAAVTQDGGVTAKAPGKATITILCGNFTAYCTVNCNFEVEPEEPVAPEETETVLPLSISVENLVFKEEGENTILHPIGGNGSEAKWKSSDEDVVTVNESGYVEAIGSGTAEITVTVGGEVATCIVKCDF